MKVPRNIPAKRGNFARDKNGIQLVSQKNVESKENDIPWKVSCRFFPFPIRQIGSIPFQGGMMGFGRVFL